MIGHELLDIADGRRLERFGDRIVDRPQPGSEARSGTDRADLVFDRRQGWRGRLDPWTIEFGDLQLELRPTDAGQIGLFPEQAQLWPWIRERLSPGPGGSILNLFAYTGATTLALAASGASVAHVDASRPTVAWARRNAELSGLTNAPVRWLVDDATDFVAREARRGRRYDGIVLDPPSYGHGASGREWTLDRGLEPLLTDLARVAAPGAFVLLTAHTPAWDSDRLSAALRASFVGGQHDAGVLELRTAAGAVLPLGFWAGMMTDR